jgi:hypothetical protein
MRKENDVDILKQQLKTSVKKLKLGRKWDFQMDNDQSCGKMAKRTTTSRYWSGHHKALTSSL